MDQITQTDPRCLVYVSSKSMARTSTQSRESLVLRLEPRLRSRFWSIILELIRSHIGHQLHCCRFLVSIYQTARRWGFQRPIWRKGRIAPRQIPPILSFTLQSPGWLSLLVIGSFQSVLKSTIARLKAGGILEIDGDDIVYSTDTYYVCLLVNGTFRHQGRDPAVSIQMRAAPPWPIWV